MSWNPAPSPALHCVPTRLQGHERQILKGVDGYVEPNHVCAIMGPSGAHTCREQAGRGALCGCTGAGAACWLHPAVQQLRSQLCPGGLRASGYKVPVGESAKAARLVSGTQGI